MDGRTWPAETEHPRPPLHPNCRCYVETTDQPAVAVAAARRRAVNARRIQCTGTIAAPTANRRYACILIKAGELKGHHVALPVEVLQRDWALFQNRTAFADHPDFWSTPSVERIIGAYANVALTGDAITAELELSPTPLAQALQPLLDEAAHGRNPPDVGLSANMWAVLTDDPDANGDYLITRIYDVESVDVVFRPASSSARLTQILASQKQEVSPMPEESTLSVVGAPIAPVPDPYLQRLAAATLNVALAEARLPAPAEQAVRTLFAGRTPLPADIDAAIAQQRSLIAALQPAVTGHDRPLDAGRITGMTTGLDQAQAIANYLFGVRAAQLPEPAMRSPRSFYRAFTGDLEFRGIVNAQHVQFAAATTTTLADLAANAVNKVFVETWEALPAYRWFEELTTVAPNDGSVKAMAWVTFGGLPNLAVVPEGSAYTEFATVADARENDSFVKQGNYLGITEEMWRNDDLQRLQMVPRALATAAIRTRSANLANIFSQASGVGPTLDSDSVVLFHTATHGNLATTALSMSAWKAVRLECYKQTELGSSKRLGCWPRFLLVPGDLYDDALVMFGYGAGAGGYPGSANNDTNPYAIDRPGDPRPRIIAVPDWTDTNDWAALVDPNEYPVLMMSYTQNPGGRTHPMPEVFSVTSPLAGLVFTNDTLPVKVRDWYAFGVAGYRGVHKRNVA
jgi:hypothetical protein